MISYNASSIAGSLSENQFCNRVYLKRFSTSYGTCSADAPT
ncbi:hypothetical protein J3B00_002411 [Pseudomonas sp. BP8]|nr:hypothetical protein [Pseudomonas sp. BP8]